MAVNKFYFSCILFTLVYLPVFSLQQLPKTAYLRIGDNQKEVAILQQILNSDPDTTVSKSGAGSPGKEIWYFGTFTEIALKKFQEKYGLEATGEIDSKTLKKLNEVAADNSGSTSYNNTEAKNTVNKEFTTEQNKSNIPSNKYIGNEEKNPYINEGNNSYSTEQKQATTSKSYISSLIDRYLGFLKSQTQPSNSYPTSPTNTNTTSPTQQTNPAANPTYPGTGASPYGTNPYSGNAIDKYSQGLPFGSGQSANFMDRLQNSLSEQRSAPVTMNTPTYDSNPGGDLAAKFTKLEDGWLSGRTSHFGTEMNGTKDKSYAPYGQSWCNAAMNSSINTCDPSVCIVSLPISAQIYFFGTEEQKKNLYKIRMLRTNKQQLAAAGGEAFYKRIGGTPMEIINTKNGVCTVAPLWETGPGEGEKGNFVIDVTPCIKKTLQDNGTAFISKFRPVPKGKRGCEDAKQFIPTTVLKK